MGNGTSSPLTSSTSRVTFLSLSRCRRRTRGDRQKANLPVIYAHLDADVVHRQRLQCRVLSPSTVNFRCAKLQISQGALSSNAACQSDQISSRMKRRPRALGIVQNVNGIFLHAEQSDAIEKCRIMKTRKKVFPTHRQSRCR